MAESVRITGIAELLSKLSAIGSAAETRAVRSGVTAGGQVILEAARQLCPKETGALERSLGKRIVSRKGSAAAIIGPRSKYEEAQKGGAGGGEVRRPVRYAHLVEKGHGGKVTAAAKPFLRPAIDNNRDVAESAMKTAIMGVIAEAAR